MGLCELWVLSTKLGNDSSLESQAAEFSFGHAEMDQSYRNLENQSLKLGVEVKAADLDIEVIGLKGGCSLFTWNFQNKQNLKISLNNQIIILYVNYIPFLTLESIAF